MKHCPGPVGSGANQPVPGIERDEQKRLWMRPSISFLLSLVSSCSFGPLSLPFSERKEIGPSVMSESREKGREKERKRRRQERMRTGMRRTTHSVAFEARIKLYSQPVALEQTLICKVIMAVAGLKSSKASVRKCCDFYSRVLDANKKLSLQIIPPWFGYRSSCSHERI